MGLASFIGDFILNSVNKLSQYWPFLMYFGAIIAFKITVDLTDKRKLANSCINDIDKMSNVEFEMYLESMFKRLGFCAERKGDIQHIGDNLITSKDGNKTIIKARRQKNEKVGVKTLREAVAAKSCNVCDNAMIVTNNFFTHQAKRFAKLNNILIWNREDLIEACISSKKATNKPLLLRPVSEIIPFAHKHTA